MSYMKNVVIPICEDYLHTEVAELAERYRVSEKTVRWCITEHFEQHVALALVPDVIKRYNAGMNEVAIAKELGVSKSLVLAVIDEAGQYFYDKYGKDLGECPFDFTGWNKKTVNDMIGFVRECFQPYVNHMISYLQD